MLEHNSNVTLEHMSSSLEADVTVTKHATDELMEFARKNFTELRKMEKRSTGTDGSMDILCRIDIGFVQTDDGKLNYFVNEVEKGPNVCLWAGDKWPNVVGEISSKVGELIYGWVGKNVA
jgi:hypothetical protein